MPCRGLRKASENTPPAGAAGIVESATVQVWPRSREWKIRDALPPEASQTSRPPAVTRQVPLAAKPNSPSNAAGIPAGSTKLVEGPEALAYNTVDGTTTTYFACVKPEGPHIQFAQGTADSHLDGFGVGGTFIGYTRVATARPGAYYVTDAATGTTSLPRDLSSPSIGEDGDVAGYPRYGRGLSYYSKDAKYPQILDLLPTAADLTVARGHVTFSQGTRGFDVDTQQDPLADLPHERQACKTLTKKQAKQAKGEGSGTPHLFGQIVVDQFRSCAWGSLELTYHTPLSASGRAALVGSAAETLSKVKTKLPKSTAFVAKDADGRTLSLITGGVLIQLRSSAGKPASTKALVRAMRHVVARLT